MAEYIVHHFLRVATEFTPETFGRLTTVGPIFRCRAGKQHKYFQVCECVCGNVSVYFLSNLRRRPDIQCVECRNKSMGRNRKTHGMTNTAEYRAYMNMINRCTNENYYLYHRYGGRGIYVCGRWLEPNGQGFINFLADMGYKPVVPGKRYSINRKDNDGPYCKNNCEWDDDITQANNKSNNRMTQIEEKSDTLTNWCRHFGVQYDTVSLRINKNGWEIMRALTTPTGAQE